MKTFSTLLLATLISGYRKAAGCFVLQSPRGWLVVSCGAKGMNVPLLFRFVLVGCLLLSCSCSTSSHFQQQFPAETSINAGAGRGDQLVADLQFADGEHLPVIVDTGASCGVLLDASLEAKLGKRLNTRKVVWPGGKSISGIYQAPPLYLGKIRLTTGSQVATVDMSQFRVGTPVKGLIGLACWRHYCIQLDFKQQKMRLLDPDQTSSAALGEAFPLSTTFISFGRLFAVHDNLAGVKGESSVIDTGCNFDGVLKPDLFEIWTNQLQSFSGTTKQNAHFPNGLLGGNSYTDLCLSGDGHFNLLGQRFLARHLVILNFPKRIMYLKQLSVGPLAEGADFFSDFYTQHLQKK